jgi:hypothetical protein
VRVSKRDRDKPIPVTDLQQVARFSAELKVYAQFRERGMGHVQAMRALYASD